jgi:flagellar protein FliO/FliZ
MYILLYLVKRYLFTFDKKSSGRFKVNVLATQLIMPRKYISLVRIKNKVYLLGVSEQSITLLDKDDSEDYEIDEEVNEKLTTANFMDYLKKSMGKR